MLATTIAAPDLLAPPQSPTDDVTAKYRAAAERERLAWKLLTESRVSGDADARSAAFAEWIAANNELREAQSLTTSVSIRKAMDEMRGCAALLARDALEEPGSRSSESFGYIRHKSFGSRPRIGQVFQGRGGAQWRVVDMTMDMLEPELFLLQMECSGNPASNGLHDVYCEDWTLFCVVHGLASAPGGTAGH